VLAQGWHGLGQAQTRWAEWQQGWGMTASRAGQEGGDSAGEEGGDSAGEEGGDSAKEAHHLSNSITQSRRQVFVPEIQDS